MLMSSGLVILLRLLFLRSFKNPVLAIHAGVLLSSFMDESVSSCLTWNWGVAMPVSLFKNKAAFLKKIVNFQKIYIADYHLAFNFPTYIQPGLKELTPITQNNDIYSQNQNMIMIIKSQDTKT